MGKNCSFKVDPALEEALDSIPYRERSVVIRQALRAYLGIKTPKIGLKGGLQIGKQSSSRTERQFSVPLDSPARE